MYLGFLVFIAPSVCHVGIREFVPVVSLDFHHSCSCVEYVAAFFAG